MLSPAIETALSRIAALNPTLHAFTAHDPALVAARAASAGQGPLANVALAIKDIIDSFDYPTRYGSPIYAHHRPSSDAAAVSQLAAAGAVAMGKTVTTEFAFFHPGPTRNPYGANHTPGGSSSGSAVAVATGMADLALGSQTAASITRPASYCGVVGFKPSFGAYSLQGVKGLAPSFDTLGTLARDVAMIARAHFVLSAPAPRAAILESRAPRRIGVCRTPWWSSASPAMQQTLLSTAQKLAEGTEVEEIGLEAFAEGADLHARIMSFEAAMALASEWRNARGQISTKLAALIETGRAMSYDDYRNALASAAALRERAESLWSRCDLLLAPAAPGAAPAGIEATGDPIFSRLWTLLRLPTLTLCAGTDAAGLPLGVQLLGRLNGDEALLSRALWVESLLPPRPEPALDH